MAGAKLAELFVDITLRGGAKGEIKALKEQIESTDNALKNNAVFYEAVTGEKIRQMSELAKNLESVSKIDQATYGKLPYMGYADKQAKADVESEIAGKQKMVALSQAELRALSGKRGMELAQKTVQSDRIKKQVEEIKNQQMMIAQHGKLGATIRQVGAIGSMVSPGALLGAGVAGLTVGHAIQQASPIHADTLGKSVDLVSAHIGTLFLPAIDAASEGLQGLAKLINMIPKPPPGTYAGTGGLIGTGAGAVAAGPLGALVGGILGTVAGSFFKGKEDPKRPATMPAHFEQFDQAWRRIQQQSASTGDLEQEILNIQMQNLPAQTAALQQIAANTANNNAPPIVPLGGTGP